MTLFSVKQFHDDVMAFHNAMDLPVADGMGSAEVRALRESLINEETWETVEKGFKARNWEQVIDGLCDLMYVTVGAAISFGFNISQFVETLPWPNKITDFHPPFEYAEAASKMLLGAKRVATDAILSGRDLEDNMLSVFEGDLNEVICALAGLVSVIGFVCSYYGIRLNEFWVEVQRANMEKKDGPVREDGKRLKPPGWRGPDHLPLIRKHWPGRDDLLGAAHAG